MGPSSNWDIMYGVVWCKEEWNIRLYKRHLIYIDMGGLTHNLRFYVLIGTFLSSPNNLLGWLH